MGVRGGGREAAAPPSWAEIGFTRVSFLKEQLIFREENLQPLSYI